MATTSQARRPRLGLVIAKKHVSKAVHRNRLKRVLRESFRLRQAEIPLVDIVVLARKDADKLAAIELRTTINRLIDDLILREMKDKSDKKDKRNKKEKTKDKADKEVNEAS